MEKLQSKIWMRTGGSHISGNITMTNKITIAPLRMRLLGCSNYFTGADSGPGPKCSTKNLLWKAWLKPCWFTKNQVYFMETCGGFLEVFWSQSSKIVAGFPRAWRESGGITWNNPSASHKIGDIPWLHQIPIVKHRVFLIIYYWLKSIYPV